MIMTKNTKIIKNKCLIIKCIILKKNYTYTVFWDWSGPVKRVLVACLLLPFCLGKIDLGWALWNSTDSAFVLVQ